MKSFDEILLFLEPMMANLNKFIQALEKEPDIESSLKKKALLKMVRHWQEEYEETCDGKFETYDDDLISDTDIEDALEPKTGTGLDEAPEGFEDDFGIKPTDFDDDKPSPEDLPDDQTDNDYENDE